MIAKFFHRLFHYHCEDCIQEELEAKTCYSCETLKQQLALVNQQNAQLIARLVKEPEQETTEATGEPVVLQTRRPLWGQRKAILESEDRERARVLKQHSEEINKLEKEVGVEDA